MPAAPAQPLVITLWETYGSNMEPVAAELAARTGLPIHRQAFSSEDIEAEQESREKQGTLGRLMRSIMPGFAVETGDVSGTLIAGETGFREAAEQNTAIVKEQAARGGIILGRNGQFLLWKRPNTLHVKLDGPAEVRTANAAESSGISRDRAAARQRIEDEFRSSLSTKTYRFDPRDNDYYDIVVNGATLPPAAVVDVILAAKKAKLG